MTEYYSPERREQERRQQHYGDQARIAELEAALRRAVLEGAHEYCENEYCCGEGNPEWIRAARKVLAKG
jgi:hypothetical protein